MWVGNNTIMDIKNDRINLYQSPFFSTNKWVYDSDSKQRIYFGSNGTTYYQGYITDIMEMEHIIMNSEIQQEQQ